MLINKKILIIFTSFVCFAQLPSIGNSEMQRPTSHPDYHSHPIFNQHPEYKSHSPSTVPLYVKAALQIVDEIVTCKKPASVLTEIPNDMKEFIEAHSKYQEWLQKNHAEEVKENKKVHSKIIASKDRCTIL